MRWAGAGCITETKERGTAWHQREACQHISTIHLGEEANAPMHRGVVAKGEMVAEVMQEYTAQQ